jgi:PAS domain-containing protein
MRDVKKALSESGLEKLPHTVYWKGFSAEELISRLRNLSANDAVLLCNFNRDSDGKYYTHRKSAEFIAACSPAPVYAMEDHYIGTGIVGGYMNTSESQGRAAANLALVILNEKRIPSVIETCPNVLMFDYNAIRTHGLDASLLPADAVILNSPSHFYSVFPEHLVAAIIVVFILAVSVIVLSVNNATRRRSEMNLQVTLQSIGDAVISTDIQGCVRRMNRMAEELTGWKYEEAEGKKLEEVFNIVNAKTRIPVENPVKMVLDTGNIVGLQTIRS